MGRGLRATREVVLRTDSGQPLLQFREPSGPMETCALTIEIHEAATAPSRVLLAVSAEAVEELHALTELVLEGRPVLDAHIVCGFEWTYDGSRFSCGLEDEHPSPLPFSAGQLFHVSSEGQPYEEPPF